MISRILPGGLVAVAVGAAMLATTAAPASGFTLSAPSLAPSLATADIDHVYYYYHHWYHGYGWHRPWGWHRHCWRGYYGHWHCRAW